MVFDTDDPILKPHDHVGRMICVSCRHRGAFLRFKDDSLQGRAYFFSTAGCQCRYTETGRFRAGVRVGIWHYRLFDDSEDEVY